MSSKMAGRASSRFSQTAVDELALERREEGLRHRVVVGVADPAHGADQARLAHALSVGQRGVLAAVVGAVDHARVGLAVPDRHAQGLDRQLQGRRGPIAQPITRRPKASRARARNKEPARVGTYVKSVTLAGWAPPP